MPLIGLKERVNLPIHRDLSLGMIETPSHPVNAFATQLLDAACVGTEISSIP